MGRTKSNTGPSVLVRVAAIARRLLRPGLIIHFVLLGSILVAIVAAWRTWGPVILGDRRHEISLDSVEVTPQPDWIRANVKAEVLDANDLLHQSALDPQITVTVARAFSVHSWVSQVKRVRKSYPAHLVVDLEYRRPVGMVMVKRDDGQPGVIPVDDQGVVLPTEDFERRDDGRSPVRDYPRINVGDTRHHGPTGTAWGDERVAGAARIAGSLESIWQAVGIHRIELAEETTGPTGPLGPIGRRAEDLMFELVTKDDRRILWGHSPGKERPGELTAPDKVALLRSGPAAGTAGAARIDLRTKIPATRQSAHPADRIPSGPR